MKDRHPKRRKLKDTLMDFFETTSLILQINELQITFKDVTPDWYLFDCLKNREDPEYSFQIEIIPNHMISPQGIYKKVFRPYPSYNYFNNFVKKFLGDLDYRKKFEIEGNWSDVVKYESATGYNINVICEYQIKILNELNIQKLRFRHFKELKTGGRDDISKMKMDKLENILPRKIIAYVSNEVQDQDMRLNALRWIGRGLKPELSIRKAKTDKEIQEKAKNH